MPFRPYPGSEADLLYGKSVKQSWLNGLYRFMALYSSIMIKGTGSLRRKRWDIERKIIMTAVRNKVLPLS